MTQQTHYWQYSKNGICRFENFPECLNNPMEMELGEAGGVQWFMKLCKMKNGTHFHTKLYFKHENRDVRMGIRVHFKYWNRTGRRYASGGGRNVTAPRDFMSSGHKFKISDVLEELNDWLKDGAITVEYGIHVESMKLDDGIWRFYFETKLFDSDNKIDGLTLKFDRSPGYHCSKELLKFHSPVLSQQIFDNRDFSTKTILLRDCSINNTFDKCLQIAHGVRLKLILYDCFSILHLAKRFQLQNVIRYCERQLIERQIWPADADNQSRSLVRYMMCSLKRVQSVEQFKQIYHSSKVDDLSSEVMRMILDKFMETEF